MKKCSNCGIDVADDTIVCPNCGSLIKNSKELIVEKLGFVFSIIAIIVTAATLALTFGLDLSFGIYVGSPTLAFGVAGLIFSSISFKARKTKKSIASLSLSIISTVGSLVCLGLVILVLFILKSI